MFANTGKHYGWFSIVMHWLMALMVFGLFGLGLYMMDLDYYSPWYNRAPALHESVGILVGALLVVRLAARFFNPPPKPLDSLKPCEIHLARFAHALFYALILAVVISGYLISTAGGATVAFFDGFEFPAIFPDFAEQEDIAGRWHDRLAWALMLLAALHMLASLKHHFIDRDSSLRRILGLKN